MKRAAAKRAAAGRVAGKLGAMTATIMGRLQGEAGALCVVLITFEYALGFVLGVLRLAVAPFILGAALSYITDGIWYLDDVSSPTFVLVQEYAAPGAAFDLVHMYAYRLDGALGLRTSGNFFRFRYRWDSQVQPETWGSLC